MTPCAHAPMRPASPAAAAPPCVPALLSAPHAPHLITLQAHDRATAGGEDAMEEQRPPQSGSHEGTSCASTSGRWVAVAVGLPCCHTRLCSLMGTRGKGVLAGKKACRPRARCREWHKRGGSMRSPCCVPQAILQVPGRLQQRPVRLQTGARTPAGLHGVCVHLQAAAQLAHSAAITGCHHQRTPPPALILQIDTRARARTCLLAAGWQAVRAGLVHVQG